ncbi:MAG: hypothetical protein AB8B86_03280 [Pseudomonadales bacterium]
MTLRIAMWSGPRNISTAMMRAWENRPDCQVIDEPLYGYYLHATGLDHPGAREVIKAQGTDWQKAVKRCVAPTSNAEAIFFQKHMVMHLLPEVERNWFRDFRHCFLIREPAEVIASYAAVRGELTLEDVGYPQMTALFNDLQRTAEEAPIVIDTNQFLERPRAHLIALCKALNIPFLEGMLQWPSGPRDSDGVWAPYWYNSVEASTGFSASKPQDKKKYPKLSASCEALVQEAEPHYEAMKRLALKL